MDCQCYSKEDDYEAFYDKRLKSLQDLKKQRLSAQKQSSCRSQLELSDSLTSKTAVSLKFEALKEKMMSLMEHDVTLMRQLLSLNTTIQTMKLGDDEDYWETKDNCFKDASGSASAFHLPVNSGLATSTPTASSNLTSHYAGHTRVGPSAVSQFLVNEDEEEEDGVSLFCGAESSAIAPAPVVRRQYFSRQNSVLRIPIPPGHLPCGGGGRRKKISPFLATGSVTGAAADNVTSPTTPKRRASASAATALLVKEVSASSCEYDSDSHSSRRKSATDKQPPSTTTVFGGDRRESTLPERRHPLRSTPEDGDAGHWHESDCSVDSGIVVEDDHSPTASHCFLSVKDVDVQPIHEYELEVFV